jgi:hypothetical protein
MPEGEGRGFTRLSENLDGILGGTPMLNGQLFNIK